MSADFQLYHVGRTFSDAARILGKLSALGATLGNRDRRTLRDASAMCQGLLTALTAPAAGAEMARVAARLSEVVQPMVSRPLLAEQLFRAHDALATLVESQPGLERLAVAPGQLSWLQEFLSECCLMLLRDLASSQLRHPPYAVGS